MMSATRSLAFIGEDEFGWSESEFDKIIKTANRAASLAIKRGLTFAVENVDTDINGTGENYFGLLEFFKQSNSDVLIQLDVANIFIGPVNISSAQAEEFINQLASKISYTHLKSDLDGKALRVLSGGSLEFETLFQILHDNNANYVAIELASDSSIVNESQVYKNIDESINYLLQKELVVIK